MSEDRKRIRVFVGDEDVTEEVKNQVFVKCFCCDEMRPISQVVWSEFQSPTALLIKRAAVQEGNKSSENVKKE